MNDTSQEERLPDLLEVLMVFELILYWDVLSLNRSVVIDFCGQNHGEE
jgi:hypothetical protein